MLFVILILLSFLAAYGIGFSLEANYFVCFFASLGLYFIFAIFSILFCVFWSLLLGKSNQTHLKKISKYTITEEGENHYYLEDGHAVPKNLINTIVYDANRPYIEVLCYNIAHWKAVVFWELYEDRQEYILHSYTKENEP